MALTTVAKLQAQEISFLPYSILNFFFQESQEMKKRHLELDMKQYLCFKYYKFTSSTSNELGEGGVFIAVWAECKKYTQ